MRHLHTLVFAGLALSAFAWRAASAEELTGAARRAYEKTTSDGNFYTACHPASGDFVFWAGRPPTALAVDGTQQPVQFETHHVGDALKTPYRCQTPEGLLTLRTKLTHTISNIQCGAGNYFYANLAVAHVGAYSGLYLVDGCFNSVGVLVQGTHVLQCLLPGDDKVVVAQCAEGADAAGPRKLH